MKSSLRGMAHTVSGPLNVCNGQVEVWLGDPGAMDGGMHRALLATLSSDERQRQNAFLFDRDRHAYLLAHGLLRLVLSGHAAVEPGDWQFDENAYGRPEVANPGAESLRFSVSHTDGLVAVAVAQRHHVGVDVENTQRDAEILELAKRLFAPSEIADLRSLALAPRHERFFDYWTLKEAYAKARGMGMSLPFQCFGFDLTSTQSPAVFFSSEMTDDARHWQFALSSPTPRHRLAIALGSDYS